jgi:hypothetical protein
MNQSECVPISTFNTSQPTGTARVKRDTGARWILSPIRLASFHLFDNVAEGQVSLDPYRRESLKILAIFKEMVPKGEIGKFSFSTMKGTLLIK